MKAEQDHRGHYRYMRERALEGGGISQDFIRGCECGSARRGPIGGVCGDCGCAIPGPDDGGAITFAEAMRLWHERAPAVGGAVRGNLWWL